MKLNFHSLAFKQTVLILLGITVIFVAMIFMLQQQVSSRMSELIMARGQEISEKHVSSIDNIFEDNAAVVKNIVATPRSSTTLPCSRSSSWAVDAAAGAGCPKAREICA